MLNTLIIKANNNVIDYFKRKLYHKMMLNRQDHFLSTLNDLPAMFMKRPEMLFYGDQTAIQVIDMTDKLMSLSKVFENTGT